MRRPIARNLRAQREDRGLRSARIDQGIAEARPAPGVVDVAVERLASARPTPASSVYVRLTAADGLADVAVRALRGDP